MADLGVQELVVPTKPSGWHKACRGNLSIAGDVVGLASEAFIPPVFGAASAAVKAGQAAYGQFKDGNVGDGLGALASGLPAMGAGFFGGGAAADAAQGVTNEALTHIVGADPSKLPDSSAQNLAQNASCGPSVGQPAVVPPASGTQQPRKPSPLVIDRMKFSP